MSISKVTETITFKDMSDEQQKLRNDFIKSNAMFFRRVKLKEENGEMRWVGKGVGKNRGIIILRNLIH